jgi:hypothetical protein
MKTIAFGEFKQVGDANNFINQEIELHALITKYFTEEEEKCPCPLDESKLEKKR